MEDPADLLERRIPDVVSTAALSAPVAAEIDFLAGRVDRWLDGASGHSAAISARSLAFVGDASAARGALSKLDVGALRPRDLAAAAWAASRVGGDTIMPLLARLDGEAGDFIDDGVPVGPRRLYTALLRAAAGEIQPAIADAAAAAAIGDARAPLWGALCRLELGRMLRTAEAVPLTGLASSAPALMAARTFFAAGGYRSLLERAAFASGPVPATLSVGRPSSAGFGVQPDVTIRSSKGLVAIRHLIDQQHRVVSAAEIACVLDGGDWKRLADVDVPVADTTDAIRAVFYDDTTRSRVTKLLRRTIQKLSDSHVLMAAHLGAAIDTGHGCRYRPTGAAVRWSNDRKV